MRPPGSGWASPEYENSACAFGLAPLSAPPWGSILRHHIGLREAAFIKRISMQELVRQALNIWFANHGMPSWEEARKKGEQK